MRLIKRTPPDANDVRTLASAATGMDLVVVSDSEALPLGYVARPEFDPCESSRASRIRRRPAFEGTGVDLVDTPRLLVGQVRDRCE